MIRYSLRCDKPHDFESWFRDSAAYDALAAAGQITCPECGSNKVAKAMMAPRVVAARTPAPAPGETPAASEAPQKVAVLPPDPRELVVRRMLQEIRRKVEEQCDYVGDRFADEARRIHYGEDEARGIYGEASEEEVVELLDEGIEVGRVPWVPRDDG
mgnify:CR=1 FL=1